MKPSDAMFYTIAGFIALGLTFGIAFSSGQVFECGRVITILSIANQTESLNLVKHHECGEK